MSLTDPPPGRPAAPRRGRPPAVDTAAIAEAVLAVGFCELTYAAVADRLGVGQATLYRHASHRDELVRLGLDLAMRQATWPEFDGGWHDVLERWALAAWHFWGEHPGAVIEATRGVLPPTLVHLADRIGAALVERGFTPRDAVLTVDLVFDLVLDNRRGLETWDAPTPVGQDGVRTDVARFWNSQEPGEPDDAVLRVRAEMVAAVHTEPETWFRRKLHVVLSGIAAELAPAELKPDRRTLT